MMQKLSGSAVESHGLSRGDMQVRHKELSA